MSAVTYTRDEIISSSDLVRHLKKYLDEIKKQKNKKFAISRNNKIEAIILSPETLDELIEHVEIYHMIKSQKEGVQSIPLEELEAEYGL